jgi:hypothetical protein
VILVALKEFRTRWRLLETVVLAVACSAGIYASLSSSPKAWIPGPSPGMTTE